MDDKPLDLRGAYVTFNFQPEMSAALDAFYQGRQHPGFTDEETGIFIRTADKEPIADEPLDIFRRYWPEDQGDYHAMKRAQDRQIEVEEESLP